MFHNIINNKNGKSCFYTQKHGHVSCKNWLIDECWLDKICANEAQTCATLLNCFLRGEPFSTGKKSVNNNAIRPLPRCSVAVITKLFVPYTSRVNITFLRGQLH